MPAELRSWDRRSADLQGILTVKGWLLQMTNWMCREQRDGGAEDRSPDGRGKLCCMSRGAIHEGYDTYNPDASLSNYRRT